MGEVVGKAASICQKHQCQPRDVYYKHWNELHELLQLPGRAYRDSIDSDFVIPAPSPDNSIRAEDLPGTVVDDHSAQFIGSWEDSGKLKGFVGTRYLYASGDSGATATFTLTAPASGEYDVRIAYQAHENRGTRVPVTLKTPEQSYSLNVAMNLPPREPHGFGSLKKVSLKQGDKVIVVVGTDNAGGVVHVDAVQLFSARIEIAQQFSEHEWSRLVRWTI